MDALIPFLYDMRHSGQRGGMIHLHSAIFEIEDDFSLEMGEITSKLVCAAFRWLCGELSPGPGVELDRM